jgi:hypothetical protein
VQQRVAPQAGADCLAAADAEPVEERERVARALPVREGPAGFVDRPWPRASGMTSR